MKNYDITGPICRIGITGAKYTATYKHCTQNLVHNDIPEEWDELKANIKSTSITHSAITRQKKTDATQKLQSDMENLTQDIDNGQNTPENQVRLEETKTELDKKEKDRHEGDRIRAKEDEYKYDEQPTKYFFNKEKKRGQQKQIHILLDDNTEIDEKDGIMTEIENFYNDLYRTNGQNNQQILDNLKQIKLTFDEQDKQMLSKIITERETIHAINKLKADKSPYEDGLTGEFYKSFKDIIEKPLTEVINNIWIQGKQPPSHKNALIKLLYKKEDHSKLKNWRPISLLNIEYKIYTKNIN